MFHKFILCLFACLGALWLFPCASVYAHELALDQLSLWPDLEKRSVRGELLVDPEYTRRAELPPGRESTTQLVKFLHHNLTVKANGHPLDVQYRVRELWTKGGATPADLVVFTAASSFPIATLSVQTSDRWTSLVVSVHEPSANSRQQARSWLLTGQDVTPSYAVGASRNQWQLGGPELFRNSPSAAPKQETLSVARRFLQLGFAHILPNGLDHILFVVVLTLGTAALTRELLLSVTAFTLGHCFSFALGVTGAVRLSPTVVEPLIALSISVVAIGHLFRMRNGASTSHPSFRWGLPVVLAFGLLHGLGFSFALDELSFSGNQWAVGLLSFNLGLEAGQAVVALGVAGLLWRLGPSERTRHLFVGPALATSAVIGIFWFVERLWQG